MADSEPKKGAENEEGDADCRDFPIRDFPDLRKLRNAYLRKDGKPVGVDSSGTPRHDDSEEDFGLTRSTDAEALEFYRQIREKCDDDDFREFLDDE